MNTFPFAIHSAAALFPVMSDEELEELAKDIKENGQRCPIVLNHGVLVDGRNRYLACLRAGVEPKFCELPECECAVRYVVSMNIHRREMSAVEKAFIGLELEKLFAEAAKERQREHGGTAPGRRKHQTQGDADDTSKFCELLTCSKRDIHPEGASENTSRNFAGSVLADMDCEKASENTSRKIAGSVPCRAGDGNQSRRSLEAHEQAAHLVGVSPRYVQEAKAIQNMAPKVANLARQGRLTMSQAKQFALLPDPQRKEAVEVLEKNSCAKPALVLEKMKAAAAPPPDDEDVPLTIEPSTPEPVRKALDEVPVFKAMLNDVRRIKHRCLAQLKEYQDAVRTEMRLATSEWQPLEAAFEVVERLIKLRMTPFGECPYCRARGHKADCRACHGCGWLPKFAYEAGVRAMNSNIAKSGGEEVQP